MSEQRPQRDEEQKGSASEPDAAARQDGQQAAGGEEADETARERGRAVARSLVPRTLSGIVYVAVNVLAVMAGPLATAILMAITSTICCWEFFRLMREDAKLPNRPVGIVFAAAMPFFALTNGMYIMLVVFLMMLVLGLWYVTNMRARITDLAITAFGVLYTSLMLCPLVLIRGAALPGTGAIALTLGIMISVWVNDACAYLVGSLLGHHRFVPKISPKKSWEGLLGGIAGCIVVWLLLMAFFPETSVTLPVALVAGITCGITGVVGDLVESRIKRGAGVKDSGRLMPGHGGLLDRSDSMLFVSAAVYFVLRLMGVF